MGQPLEIHAGKNRISEIRKWNFTERLGLHRDCLNDSFSGFQIPTAKPTELVVNSILNFQKLKKHFDGKVFKNNTDETKLVERIAKRLIIESNFDR